LGDGVTVVTATTKAFHHAALVQASLCARFGLRHVIHDLDNSGLGRSWPSADIDGWRFKPTLLAELVCSASEPVVWMDADAWPIGPVAEVFDDDRFDVAVTLRGKLELNGKDAKGRAFLGWINAGVMFIRPTKPAREFVARWKAATVSVGNDQQALNQTVFGDEYGKHPGFGKLLKSKGARVLCLDGRKYNYRDDPTRAAKDCRVLHMTGKRWQRFLSLGDWIKK